MEMDLEKFGFSLPEDPPQQRSFLLRCMETRGQTSAQSGQSSGWLFSLHDSKDNVVHSFRDLNALMLFLQNVLNEDSEELPQFDEDNRE